MAVIRVNKTSDYTVMSNTHLRQKEMSLKAKGLLSVMLALPDDWDYSINGLCAICKESQTSIRSALGELEQYGYLTRERTQDEKGQFDYIYNIYEKPITDNPQTEKPYTENPHTDNRIQLNTNKPITKKQNTDKQNTKGYITPLLGTYQNIKLTEAEYTKLKTDYSNADAAINFLSEYIELKGYKAKSHYLALRKWVFDAVKDAELKRIELEQREKRAAEIGKQQSLKELKNFYGDRKGVLTRNYTEAELNGLFANLEDTEV